MIEQLVQQLLRDEGLRLRPYRDTVGKLTIGVGRNLDDVGVSGDEARYLLHNDVSRTLYELASHLPWTTNLDLARRGVLANMAFNLGMAGLLGFKKMLRAVQNQRYLDAAREMLDSKWAAQVGDRATRLAKQMTSGEWT